MPYVVEFEILQIAYAEVPKAASKSINRALRDVMRIEVATLRGKGRNRRAGKWWRPELVEAAELRRRWPGHFRFTVVRDPVQRFESLFYQRINAGDINTYALRFGASEWTSDPHGMRQVDLIGTDLSVYDFVGRVEDMAEVHRVLSERIGYAIRLPHDNASARGPGLHGEALAAIHEHYRADYDLLGYRREPMDPEPEEEETPEPTNHEIDIAAGIEPRAETGAEE